MGELRKELEGALTTPTAPDAADRFNRATVGLRGLAASVVGIDVEMTALGHEAAKMSHIPEHPRQQDKRIEEWEWGDLFLARRTDAFVRTAFRIAQSPAERALAFGVLASCSANICGSAYLGQVVGGPRRSHRFRSRLGGNAVGSWFAQTHPEVKALRDVADSVRLGGAASPTLPPDISAFLTACLTQTYDPARTPPPPDLQLGYQRLIEHLELLDAFPQPAYLPRRRRCSSRAHSPRRRVRRHRSSRPRQRARPTPVASPGRSPPTTPARPGPGGRQRRPRPTAPPTAIPRAAASASACWRS
ncbi:MAG: hypothetical protein ABJC62_06270 [Frankiaceae bacterium]